MLASLRRLGRTPFATAAGNPVFERDISGLHRASSAVRVQRTARRALFQAALVVVTAWLLLWMLSASGYSATTPQYIYYASSGVVFWLMLIALGCGALLDMLALRAALPLISGEVHARRWELLRLTPLRESSIVSAKHAAAQLRVWRALALVVGLRAATAALFLVNLFGLSHVLTGAPPFLREELVALPLIVVAAAVFIVIYLFEPVWRVQAMTALGMVVSAHVLESALATLAAGGALLLAWLTQALIVGALLAALSVMIMPVALFGAGAVSAAAVALGFSLLIALVVFSFHRMLMRWALRRVYRRISRPAN
jgi:hypothetical protein